MRHTYMHYIVSVSKKRLKRQTRYLNTLKYSKKLKLLENLKTTKDVHTYLYM